MNDQVHPTLLVFKGEFTIEGPGIVSGTFEGYGGDDVFVNSEDWNTLIDWRKIALTGMDVQIERPGGTDETPWIWVYGIEVRVPWSESTTPPTLPIEHHTFEFTVDFTKSFGYQIIEASIDGEPCERVVQPGEVWWRTEYGIGQDSTAYNFVKKTDRYTLLILQADV